MPVNLSLLTLLLCECLSSEPLLWDIDVLISQSLFSVRGPGPNLSDLLIGESCVVVSLNETAMVWSKQNTNVYSVSESVQPLGCDALLFLRIIFIFWLLISMCRSPPCRQLPFMCESLIYLFIFKFIPSEGATKDKNPLPCHGGKQWWEHRETPKVNPVPEYSAALELSSVCLVSLFLNHLFCFSME